MIDTCKTLSEDALNMVQNTIKNSSLDIYSTTQPGGSIHDSLWDLYLKNQKKYQEQK
ncbi:MAG: hypothetical protein R3E32_20135 [Chitinophagales bacterium]